MERYTSALALLFAIALHAKPTVATLTFQRTTDYLGTASVFDESDANLPTRNWTLSSTVRSSSGRNVFFLGMAGNWYRPELKVWELVVWGAIPFYPLTKFSEEDLLMNMRTWTLTYDDAAGEISAYIDAVYIGTFSIHLYPGSTRSLPLSSIDLGSGWDGSAFNDYDGIYGQFNALQYWDRALNASEIAQLAALPESLTGNEEGLSIFWRADRGFGNRIPNLGSAGATYDGILGKSTTGFEETTGSGCNTIDLTSPAWANRSAGGENLRPIADNLAVQVRTRFCCRVPSRGLASRCLVVALTQVIESTSAAQTSVTIYFTGYDADGDLLDFAVTRLPSHGVLELESSIEVGSSSCADDDAAAMAIAGVDCPTAAEYGYCDSYLCPDCAYAEVCDAACGYCSTCADDDAAAMAIAGVDCSTAAEYGYCDSYLCPDCAYAEVCDAACGYCSTTTAPANVIPITNVTYRCWETFARYRLVWTPEETQTTLRPSVLRRGMEPIIQPRRRSRSQSSQLMGCQRQVRQATQSTKMSNSPSSPCTRLMPTLTLFRYSLPSFRSMGHSTRLQHARAAWSEAKRLQKFTRRGRCFSPLNSTRRTCALSRPFFGRSKLVSQTLEMGIQVITRFKSSGRKTRQTVMATRLLRTVRNLEMGMTNFIVLEMSGSRSLTTRGRAI